MTTVLDVIQRLLPIGTSVQRPDQEPCKVSWHDPPQWPPDLFAVAATLVNLSGCYAHSAVTRGEWLIPGDPSDFAQRTQELGEIWQDATEDLEASQRLSGRLKTLWGKLLESGHRSVAVHLSGNLPPWCAAALELLAIADEASAGMGFDYGSKLSALLVERRYGENSSSPRRTATLCELVPPEESCVQPRARTPQVGCTLRSLSHHLALLPPIGEVTTRYLNRPDPPDDDRLNLLLVPFPYSVGNDIVTESARHSNENWGTFKVKASWCDDVSADEFAEFLIDLVNSANASLERDERGKLHGIVLPELALPDYLATRTAEILGSETELELFVTGALAAGDPLPRNVVFSFQFFGGTERKPMSWEQAKHHRWRLSQPQLDAYGFTLNATIPWWWEGIDVANREVVIHAFRKSATLTTLICEDLARIDPVQHVVRAVGPNLLIALLMDGPQFDSRWPARYASVLADDPGTSVLTFTSLSLVERSDKSYAAARGREPPSKATVARWTDDERSECLEIGAEAHALALSLSLEQVEERTMDRRADGTTTVSIKFMKYSEVRASAPPLWARRS